LLIKESQEKKDLKLYDDLVKQYKIASMRLENEINKWYGRYAANNEFTFREAKLRLKADELEEFQWTVQEYIKFGKENALNQQWMKELENASIRVHVSRLEALQIQMKHQIEVLYDGQLVNLEEHIKKSFEDTYYHTAYEIQNGFNIGWNLHKFNDDELKKIIFKPWTVDNKTFSDRIWNNKQELINTLHTELTQSIIRGDGPKNVIIEVKKLLGAENRKAATYKAGRLVMSESAFFSSSAQQKCFNDLDVEKFEVVATLDSHTSEICQDLDGDIFDMKDYEIGVTAPPFHVWCRTTTVPWFDDNYTDRAARGADGKTYYVDGNMNYKEWHKEYIENNPEAIMAETKLKNRHADKNQFEEYREILGASNLTKTLDDFQNIKYNNTDDYGIIKAQVKGMGYYNRAVSNEAAITEHVKNVAEIVGMDTAGLEYRIKGKDSYLRKIRSNYNPDGNEYEIKDILRYTYTSAPDEYTYKTLKAIDTHKDLGYNTIEIKNYWLNDLNPYQGINTVVVSQSGQKFELQYHTPESFKIKNEEMHKLYEKQRLISDTSSMEYIELTDKMFELSNSIKIPVHVEEVKK
jgi:SPP1 gp7 family putative phage head morphogenesis protein